MTVGDAALHVEIRDGEREPHLLFLHGGMCTLADFAPLAHELADYKIAALDSRGHGASTLGSEPLSYPRLARDIEHVIHELGLANVVLVGHSDGGIAALHVKLPVAGLVLIGVDPTPPDDESLAMYATLTEAVWRERHPEMMQAYDRVNPAPDYSALYAAAMRMWTDPANYPSARPSVPTLVVRGSDDHLISNEATVALASEIEGAQLAVIPYGTHMVHAERAAWIAPMIRTFLERLAPA